MTRDTDTWLVGAVLALALAVGGSGVNFPMLQMLLQICSLALVARIFIVRRNWHPSRKERFAIGLLGAAMLLPLLQLVPLPPSIWSQLAGRNVGQEVDAALNVTRWRPLTLDVEGTVRALTNLLPAAAVFIAALSLPLRNRMQFLVIVVAFACVSAFLGVIQFATDGWLMPYPSGHSGSSVGLFVNRNHHAAFLLASIPVVAFLTGHQIAMGKSRTPWVVACLTAILLLGISVLATTSRMGLALLPIVVAASLIVIFFRHAGSKLAIGSTVLIAALAFFLVADGFLDAQLARFSSLDDPRFSYWEDIRWALTHYGFAGTGIGTFVPVYQSAESLESVVPQVINHAHNDYLEILLEGGVLGAVLLVTALGFLGFHMVRSFRRSPEEEGGAVRGAASLGIAILLAASLVDYPLRMPALSCLFALFVALLLAPLETLLVAEKARATSWSFLSARWVTLVAILVMLSGLAYLSVQAGVSNRFLLKGEDLRAKQWASWSTLAHERLASQAMLDNDPQRSLEHATAALVLSPISAPAVRSAGLAKLAEGEVSKGQALMQIAVVLGWRDGLTQLWAIEAAKQSNEPEKALQRAEGLFRQGKWVVPALTQLLSDPTSSMPGRLAKLLANQPDWRSTLFSESQSLAPDAQDAWLKMIKELKASSAPASLEEGRPLLEAMITARQYTTAQKYWGLLQTADALVANGDFQDSSDRRGRSYPKYWYVPRENRSAVSVENSSPGSPNRVLTIRAEKRDLVLRQQILLSPGTYRFSYQVRPGSKKPEPWSWSLRCEESGRRDSISTKVSGTGNWQFHAGILNVPNQDCQIQQLALTYLDGTVPLDFAVDNIRIARTSR